MFYVRQITVSQSFKIWKKIVVVFLLYLPISTSDLVMPCALTNFTNGCTSSCSSCKRAEDLKPEKSSALDGSEENLNSTHKGDEWLILVCHHKDTSAKIPFLRKPLKPLCQFLQSNLSMKSLLWLAFWGRWDTFRESSDPPATANR